MMTSTADIETELANVRDLLVVLPDIDAERIDKALSLAENKLHEKESSKENIGQTLEKVLDYAKESPFFSHVFDELECYVQKIVNWLGSDWSHILNLLNSIELGKKFPIVIEEYDAIWVELYQKEAQFLKSEFYPDVIRHTEHFGSTAVPGLAAKPVIDILVKVTTFAAAQRQITPRLENLGYIYFWRSDQPPGHMMFVKGYGQTGYIPGVPLYHLHLAPEDHPLWDRLLFRDYLRTDPETAHQYEQLKYTLARRYRFDREAYTRGKEEFVLFITDKAKSDQGLNILCQKNREETGL